MNMHRMGHLAAGILAAGLAIPHGLILDAPMIPMMPARKPRPADAVPAPSVGPVSRQVRRQEERRQAKVQRSRDKLIALMAAKAWRRQGRLEAQSA